MTNGIEDFSRVVELHKPVIFRFVLASLRDEDLAQTLTQECFLKAYRNRSTFRGESSVRTWLLRIAVNLEKDYWRDRRNRFWREVRAKAIDVDLMCDYLRSAERSPEEQLLAREQAARIWKVVETMSMRERSVFLLRYQEELKLTEIGHSTGLKTSTVKIYLARARTKLRTVLRNCEK